MEGIDIMEENIEQLVSNFKAYHQEDPDLVASCGGRFEILGNHTDHNHGLCIASACNLEIIAAVKKNNKKIIRLKSLGFPIDELDLSDLTIKNIKMTSGLTSITNPSTDIIVINTNVF